MSSREPFATQRIAVAVVRRGAEYVIGRRPPGAPLAGLWEFPGGKIGPGESPRQAAVRECLEETGLTVEFDGVLAVVQHEYPHGHLELHFVNCRPTGDTDRPRAPFQWTPAAALVELEFPAANASVLAQLRDRHDSLRQATNSTASGVQPAVEKGEG